MTVFSRLSAVIAVGLLPSLAACQPPPPPPVAPAQATAQRTKQEVATVESVDMNTRMVILRAADGSKGLSWDNRIGRKESGG